MLVQPRHRSGLGSVALVVGGGLFTGIITPSTGAAVGLLSVMVLGLLALTNRDDQSTDVDGHVVVAALGLFIAAAAAPVFGPAAAQILATIAGFAILSAGLMMILWEDLPGRAPVDEEPAPAAPDAPFIVRGMPVPAYVFRAAQDDP